MYTYNQLKKGVKTLSQVEDNKKTFKSVLGQISSGYHKSENQLNTIENVKNLFNSRQKTIDLLNDNSRTRFEFIYKGNKKKSQEQDLKY